MASTGRWAAVPVDHQLDPRVLQLSVEAELFLDRAWLYAAEHGTDGLVPVSAMSLLAMKMAGDPEALTDELVAVGIARRRKDGLVLVDFLHWNPSARQMLDKSEHARKAAIARWAKVKQGSDQIDGSGVDDASSMPGALPDAESSNAQDVTEQTDKGSSSSEVHALLVDPMMTDTDQLDDDHDDGVF